MGYTESYACGLLYQMGVDFISHDIRTKPDRLKQEEFLITLLERVTEYTFEYILCNRQEYLNRHERIVLCVLFRYHKKLK